MIRAISYGFVVTGIGLLLLTFGCTEKYPLESLPDPSIAVRVGDTTYVEIEPPFEGFEGASAIHIGNDQLMYIADTKRNRIVMLNTAGQILSVRDSVVQPLSVTQDYRLQLIVGAATVEANGDTAGALFRIALFPVNHNLALAQVDTLWRERSKPRRRFVGVTALPNNEFLAARRGPDNSSFVDPDGRVLRFNDAGQFITPLADLTTRAGSGITDINFPSGIASFPNSNAFIVTQSSEGIAYGALWMEYQRTVDFDGWLPRFDPANPDERAVDFIRPNRFVEPMGVAFDRSRRDIFIVDAGLDSVFKFDSRGRFKSESFGQVRTSGKMIEPVGVAFFDRTLYVLDRKQGKIFRFKLSTDF